MKNSLQRINIVKSLAPSLVGVGLIWVVFLVERAQGTSFADWGILPGTLTGLRGIFFSPFIHADLVHIANNTMPLGVLLGYVFAFYRELAVKVVLFSILFTGFWVWLSARPSYHIGASGLIYALSSFLFFSGILRRNLRLMAVSLSIAFLYGSMIWGVFPIKEEISFESHLWGAVSGGVLAFYYRKAGLQRIPLPWEEVPEDEYLRDNIQRYGEFYWDPVKRAEIHRAREEQDNTLGKSITIVYFVKADKKEEAAE